jgi:hypothetical protein
VGKISYGLVVVDGKKQVDLFHPGVFFAILNLPNAAFKISIWDDEGKEAASRILLHFQSFFLHSQVKIGFLQGMEPQLREGDG